VPDTLDLSQISRSKSRIEVRAQDTIGFPPDEGERLFQLPPRRRNEQKGVCRAKNQSIPRRGCLLDRGSVVADLDDNVTVVKDSEVVLVDSEQVSDPPVAQRNPNVKRHISTRG
jgi:hypothetical protein